MAVFFDHEIKVGESLELEAVVEDDGVATDLTGCSAEMSIRRTYDTAVVGSGSTSDGRITITPLSGLVEVNIPPVVTGALAPGQYKADLKLTYPSGAVEYLFEVQLSVIRRVTV